MRVLGAITGKEEIYMKKRITVFALVICLVCALSVSAFATSYAFYFTTPYVGCMNSSGVSESATSNPYVKQSYTTAQGTTYFLSPSRFSSTQATNLVSNVTNSSTHSFTYKSGYGIGSSYYLSGVPYSQSFSNYVVDGTWSA